jgi:hypothetical protein
MTSKRKYQHVRRRTLSWNQDDYIPDVLRDVHRATPIFDNLMMERWRRQAGRYHNQPKGALAYPHVNGLDDPLTLAMLFDALLRLNPASYVVSAEFADALNEEYPQIRWDPITVGRCLSDIYSMGHELASTRPNKPFDSWNPFDRTQNGSIRYYIIAPDEVSRLWFGKVREYMGCAAMEQARHIRAEGKPLPLRDSLWVPVMDFKWGDRPENPAEEIAELRKRVTHAAKQKRRRANGA